MIRRGDPIVFVTGSGLSAPSGIPTFRGENGVWAKWVTEWGTRAAFLADPQSWWNKFWIPAHVVAEPGSTIERQYAPSGGHFAIAEIANHEQTNVKVITQNIDGLHHAAGLPSDMLVEVHGRGGLYKCVRIGCRYAEHESIEGAPLDLRLAEEDAPPPPPPLPPIPSLQTSTASSTMAATDEGSADPPVGYSIAMAAAVATPSEAASSSGDPPLLNKPKTTTVIGSLPSCPSCGNHTLPQTLLFDEEYDSHAFYQYRKARRWLSSAKAIVFVGTSFAVGITEQALGAADDAGIPTYTFNLVDTDPAQHAKASIDAAQPATGVKAATASNDEPPLPCPVMHHVIGGCEVTLPKLSQLVSSDKSKNIDEWYAGKVDEGAATRVLAGFGSEWTERTTGDEKKQRGRSKKRNREKAVARHETTWVACDACGKWRRLPQGVVLDEHEQNGRWTCKQNIWDREKNYCGAEEDPW